MHYKKKYTHKNKHAGGPKRERQQFEDDPNISLQFATPESLTETYINALKEWNSANEVNATKQNIITTNRGLFLLLIILGLLTYYQPSYLQPLAGEELIQAQTEALKQLVASGLTYDVIQKQMDIFTNQVTSVRFSFASGEAMTAAEILALLKQNDSLAPLIESLERGFTLLRNAYGEVSGLASSSYGLFENLSQGNINRKNIGDVVGYGIWSMVLFLGFTITSTAVNITRNVSATISRLATPSRVEENSLESITGIRTQQGLNTLLHMNVDGKETIVTLQEIITVIKNRPPDIVTSFFDTMLSKLFSHEEQWTIDTDSANNSTSSSYIGTVVTEKSAESLTTVSENGYGGEFSRMASFISSNYGSSLELAKDYIIGGFTNIYKPLLKVACMNGQEMDIDESQVPVSKSNNPSQESGISDITLDVCIKLDDVQIEYYTNSAVAKTVLGNTNNPETINAAKSLMNLRKRRGGKRLRRTKKNKSKRTTRKKRRISRRKTAKRG